MTSKAAKNTTTDLNQKPELGKKRKSSQSVDDIFTYSNQMKLTFSHSTKDTRTTIPIDSSDEEEEECVVDFTRISEDEEEDDEKEELADDSQELLQITDSEESFTEKSLNSSSRNRSPSPSPPPPSQAELLRVQRQLRAKDRTKVTRDFDLQFSLLKQRYEADSCSPVTTHVRQSSEIINLDDTPSPVVRNKERKIPIKVRTRSGIKRFNMKAGDRFEVILKDLADSQNVPVENIMLSLNHNNILPDDSPLSKGVTVADIIECVIMESGPVVDEENLIEIKVQGNDAASRKTFSVSKTKPLGSLFTEYAKFRKMPKSKLKFLFDGDILQGSETPEELDMEDENVIDVQLL